MSLRDCSAAHCSGIDKELNEVCKQEGWAIGHPVITRDADGPCQCHCSCLALGTPLAMAKDKYKAIEDYKVGDVVWAAGPDLKFHEVEVKFSDGTSGGSAQPYSVYIEYDDSFLIVTADHLFLMPSGRLKKADKLSVSDSLVAPDGGKVEIKNITMGTFYGGFHHIATSTVDPKGDLKDHLLDANGVVCADYAVQLFHKESDAVKKCMADGHDDLPTLGTTAYFQKHGEPPDLAIGVRKRGYRFASGATPGKGEKVFVPMKHARIVIPDDAVSFIPEEQARELSKYPMRPFTDPDSQAWTEYLITQHQAFYPDVVYSIDWYNDEVNAYAYKQDGVGHVVLLGGLIRFPCIEIEALSLIISHEVGHLIGGPPYYPDTDMSCEGQADYFGVRNIMRKVWFGEYYYTVTTDAITQMKVFFGLPPFKGTGARALGGCSHPPGDCRIETYNAALDLLAKPECAG